MPHCLGRLGEVQPRQHEIHRKICHVVVDEPLGAGHKCSKSPSQV